MGETTQNHDALRDLAKDVEYIKLAVDELREGKAGVCVKHAGQLKGLWSNINRLWWVVGLVLSAVIGVGIAHAFGKG